MLSDAAGGGLILSGSDTYTGGTTVADGTLWVTATSTACGHALTVGTWRDL